MREACAKSTNCSADHRHRVGFSPPMLASAVRFNPAWVGVVPARSQAGPAPTGRRPRCLPFSPGEGPQGRMREARAKPTNCSADHRHRVGFSPPMLASAVRFNPACVGVVPARSQAGPAPTGRRPRCLPFSLGEGPQGRMREAFAKPTNCSAKRRGTVGWASAHQCWLAQAQHGALKRNAVRPHLRLGSSARRCAFGVHPGSSAGRAGAQSARGGVPGARSGPRHKGAVAATGGPNTAMVRILLCTSGARGTQRRG